MCVVSVELRASGCDAKQGTVEVIQLQWDTDIDILLGPFCSEGTPPIIINLDTMIGNSPDQHIFNSGPKGQNAQL